MNSICVYESKDAIDFIVNLMQNDDFRKLIKEYFQNWSDTKDIF